METLAISKIQCMNTRLSFLYNDGKTEKKVKYFAELCEDGCMKILAVKIKFMEKGTRNAPQVGPHLMMTQLDSPTNFLLIDIATLKVFTMIFILWNTISVPLNCTLS